MGKQYEEDLGRVADGIEEMRKLVSELKREAKKSDNERIAHLSHEMSMAIDEIEAGLAPLWTYH